MNSEASVGFVGVDPGTPADDDPGAWSLGHLPAPAEPPPDRLRKARKRDEARVCPKQLPGTALFSTLFSAARRVPSTFALPHRDLLSVLICVGFVLLALGLVVLVYIHELSRQLTSTL